MEKRQPSMSGVPKNNWRLKGEEDSWPWTVPPTGIVKDPLHGKFVKKQDTSRPSNEVAEKARMTANDAWLQMQTQAQLHEDLYATYSALQAQENALRLQLYAQGLQNQVYARKDVETKLDSSREHLAFRLSEEQETHSGTGTGVQSQRQRAEVAQDELRAKENKEIKPESRGWITSNVEKLGKERLEDSKLQKKEETKARNKAIEIADLKAFAKKFKLATPMPIDLARILFKEEKKREALLRDSEVRSRGDITHQNVQEHPPDQTQYGKMINSRKDNPLLELLNFDQSIGVELVGSVTPTKERIPVLKAGARSISGTISSAETIRTKKCPGPMSTVPTSITDGASSSKGAKTRYALTQEQIASTNLVAIEEELENPANDETQTQWDGHSTISSLTLLDSKQSKDIVKKFIDAILKAMPLEKPHQYEYLDLAFQEHFQVLLKNYSEGVAKDIAKGTRRQAVKRIRFLRREISEDFENALRGLKVVTKTKEQRAYPKFVEETVKSNPEKNWEEKVEDWKSEPLLNEARWSQNIYEDQLPEFEFSHQWSQPSCTHTRAASHLASVSNVDFADSSSESRSAEIIHTTAKEDQEIYYFLTSHCAFKELVDQLQELIERHYNNKMELIRHRILTSISHPIETGKHDSGRHCAMFSLDWDLLTFLQEQYTLGLVQDLGSILTITGEATNAYMTTVRTYLGKTWPSQPLILLSALQEALSNTPQGETSGVALSHSPGNNIAINLVEQSLLVTGSEDFIATIAQQAAWLVSVCRVSSIGLGYSSASLRADISKFGLPLRVFHISCDIFPVTSDDPGSCWNEIVGNTVIANGFPIPERQNSEKGLELAVEVMAGLGGVPLATEFDGGIILKGRLIAFIPVERRDSSVQWHFVKKLGARIRYTDVINFHPSRLGVNILNHGELSTTRAFLGWCPDIVNILGTGSANYTNVKLSKARRRTKRFVALTSFAAGFSEKITGQATFTLGKHNGSYTAENSSFYSEMLDDAEDLPVILHDMGQRRGWQTDGERIILHIILHRQSAGKYMINGHSVQLQAADCGPADSSSVRRAMKHNAGTVVMVDHEKGKAELSCRLFKDVAHELYHKLESMQEFAENEGTDGLKLKWNWKKQVLGYEYMDLVRRKHEIAVKEPELRKTCGDWPEYARDIGALVLFGIDFGDMFRPRDTAGLCPGFKSVPQGKDFLAIEVATLQSLHAENGSEQSENQITPNGLQWSRSTHLFQPCPLDYQAMNGLCRCERIQEFVPTSMFRPTCPPGPLSETGAVIFGQVSSRLHKNPSKNQVVDQNVLQRQQKMIFSQVNLALPVPLQSQGSFVDRALRQMHGDDRNGPLPPDQSNSEMARTNLSRLNSQLGKSRLGSRSPRQTSDTTDSSAERSSNAASTGLGYTTPATSYDARSEDEHITPFSFSSPDFDQRVEIQQSLYSDILKSNSMTTPVPDTVPFKGLPQPSYFRQFNRSHVPGGCQFGDITTYGQRLNGPLDKGKGVDKSMHPLHTGQLELQQQAMPRARSVSTLATSTNSLRTASQPRASPTLRRVSAFNWNANRCRDVSES